MEKECSHNKKNSNKIKEKNRKQEEGNSTNKLYKLNGGRERKRCTADKHKKARSAVRTRGWAPLSSLLMSFRTLWTPSKVL